MTTVRVNAAYPTWPNIQAFYDERGGERSGESYFGVHHWVNQGNDWATHFDCWRVSVVADTGDVYACDRTSGEILLLGALVAGEGDQLAAERINARHRDMLPFPPVYCAADRVFEGWAEGNGLGRNLAWFVERITQEQEVAG